MRAATQEFHIDGSSWAKNPMDNGFRQKITPHCTLELPGVWRNPSRH